jgi:hypothetical protein
MFKRVMISVFATTGVAMLVATLGTEANAGCIPLSNGGQFCAAWLTGSEICAGTVAGFGNCLKNGTCQVLCAAGGTFLSDGTTHSGACNNNADNFPLATDNCFLTGTGTCTTHGGKFNDPDNTGQPFIIEGPISSTVEVFKCDKNGRCQFFNELQPSSEGTCPNRNWTLDFTANEFKGLACACEGGTYGQTTSTGLPECSGVETCQLQRCTLSGSNYICTAAVALDPTP